MWNSNVSRSEFWFKVKKKQMEAEFQDFGRKSSQLQNCFHPILDIDTYLVNNRFPNRAYYAGKTFRFIPCC